MLGSDENLLTTKGYKILFLCRNAVTLGQVWIVPKSSSTHGQGESMGEKRKVIRRHLYDYFKVYDKASNELLGELVDISPDGIKLLCANPVDSASLISVKIVLPNLPKDDKEGEMCFDAKCMWCHPSPDSTGYEAGFKLLNISPKEIELMKNTFWGNW